MESFKEEEFDEYGNRIRTELIDGELTMMSPSPSINHNFIASRIYTIFDLYLENKKCTPFGDNVDLYLSEKDRFIPDFMIVCDPDKLEYDGVHGAPDLVVEVLSPSSARRDYGKKMDAYEKAGVKEYWVINQDFKTIDVFILRDGKFRLDNEYYAYSDEELKEMTEEERAEVRTEFKCSLFDDLSISIRRIFSRVQKRGRLGGKGGAAQ